MIESQGAQEDRQALNVAADPAIGEAIAVSIYICMQIGVSDT